MTDLVFFYGTLMSGFRRPGRASLDRALRPMGRGWISAALFDLGIYPAAVPAADPKSNSGKLRAVQFNRDRRLLMILASRSF